MNDGRDVARGLSAEHEVVLRLRSFGHPSDGAQDDSVQGVRRNLIGASGVNYLAGAGIT